MITTIHCYHDGTLEVCSRRVGRLELPEGTLKDDVVRALDGLPLYPEDPDDAIEECERALKEVRGLLLQWQLGERSTRSALEGIAYQADYEERRQLRPFQAREMRPGDLGLRWVTSTLMSLPDTLNAELREV